MDLKVESHLKSEQSPLKTPEGPLKTGEEGVVLPILPIKGEGVNWRFNAFFIDLIIIIVIYSILIFLMALLTKKIEGISRFNIDIAPSILGGVSLLGLPIIWLLYFTLSETFTGMTLGKASSHLRVIRKDGGKISWWQAAIRAFLGIFEDNIIAALIIWVTPLHQRLADLIAGTLVVNRSRLHQVEFDPPAATFEFHDSNRIEYAQLTNATLHKFGFVRNLVVRGTGRDGRPIKITVYGQFQKSQLEVLRHELAFRYKIPIIEKIILWRLLLGLFLAFIVILTIYAIFVEGTSPHF
jgi:uncharacterized RDD family membrane protein YckC